MKKLIFTSIFLLVTTLGAFAQQKVHNEKLSKQLEQIDTNLYKVTFTDAGGEVVQTGQYWKDKDLYKPHGLWTLYCAESGDIVTRSRFYRGTQKWVETKIDGKMVMFTEKQLAIKDLEGEIKKLQSKLAALKDGTN